MLLPWGDGTVISQLIAALNSQQPDLCEILVLVRAEDLDLQREVHQAGAVVVNPLVDAAPPAHMRESVELLLAEVERRCQPQADAGWLLIPGDHPIVDLSVLQGLVKVWSDSADRIIVPTYRGRRGHPTLFPWSLAAAVAKLPQDQGLNSMLRSHAHQVTEMACDSPTIHWDLDTPEDYERCRNLIRQHKA